MIVRIAKILEPPPKMVNEITDFCVGVLGHKLLNLLKDEVDKGYISRQDESVTKLEFIFGRFAKKLVGREIEGNNFYELFDFDFDGWNNPWEDNDYVKKILQSEGITGIFCDVKFVESGKNHHKALWIANKWTMKIFIEIEKMQNIADFKIMAIRMNDIVWDLQITIQHELIHMVQSIGMIVKNIKKIPGLPTKDIQSKEYSEYGWKGEEQKPHALIDVEFYTNLSDSISKYKETLKNIPDNLKDEFTRIFIGGLMQFDEDDYPESIRHKIVPDDFFYALKINDTKRWQLAVKRFMSAIGK